MKDNDPTATSSSKHRAVWVATLAVVVAVAAAVGWLAPWSTSPQPIAGNTTANPGALHHVGTQVCAQCHTQEAAAWKGSHHELAMQSPSRAAVLAPFRGERASQNGASTVFSERDGKFLIRTEGPDGKTADFEVAHTLGFTPLQQYLIAMPNGGLQAFNLAWDSRTADQGGQRWFNLQGTQRIAPGDELHWSGRQNNASFMCVECHTTQFKKNFNADLRQYQSTWSESHVACEACHGPGSGHVAWAAKPSLAAAADTSKGLLPQLNERHQVQWTLNATGNASRSTPPAAQRREMAVCAQCHSHRSQVSDARTPGQPLMDTHIPSLLDKRLFWGDGQMKAEVYNDASFQQSKMYQKGVTCSDCHNPHTLKLRAPGNQVCFQCHAPTKYETPSHHFHPVGSSGSSCASCHMPTTTFMSIDPRHDHSLRVPRPDLSVGSKNPNACTQCHTGKTAQWAAQWAAQWYPGLASRHTPLVDALQAADAGDAQALALLFKVITDTDQSAMARASALSRAVPILEPAQLQKVRTLLGDADALVRRTAVESLAGMPPAVRAEWLRPLLQDPIKGVRIAAARWLADAAVTGWDTTDRAHLDAALEEYIAVQRFNADRPESYNNLGTLYADMGKWPQAEAALQQAIALDPGYAMSSLNLADVYQAQGRESDAQRLIESVIQKHPGNASAHHALGLSLVRQQQKARALAPLRRAAQLEPDNARFAYVLAVLLENSGQVGQAIVTLEKALQANPADRDTANALRLYCARSANARCPEKYKPN